MNKTKRQEIFNKYNGRCAYSGKPLGNNWQIDHIIPKIHYVWRYPENKREEIWKIDYNLNDNINLMPSISIVNHYKRALDLEGFREYLRGFHLRLKKVPKNPRIERRQKYKEYMFSIAKLFDITPDNPFNGIFYFETVNKL